jgi:SPP1 family phage portal protein
MVISTAQPLTSAFIIKCINDKLADNHRLQRLQDYYEGKQDILLRRYNDPTQPNNKIVVNYCKKITDFMTAYLVGVPVKFEAPQIILDSLNYNDQADTQQEIVKNMNVMGLGCELFYTDGDGHPRFASIDPRESIFIMDDSVEAVLTAYIRVYPDPGDIDGYHVTIYTPVEVVTYTLALSVGELKQVEAPQRHYWGDVPAILYMNNREMTGSFEVIITLQDALNKLFSDELNDFEKFVDAFLVLTGVQATTNDDIAKMKQDRVLLLDAESAAQWLVKDVNNTHIKELKENITKKIHELGGIPDIENLGSFGTSGIALRYKLLSTEIQASRQERILQHGIQRKLELLYNILRISDPSMGTYTDVKVNFERNFVMLSDDKLKQQQLDNQLVNDQILSRETFLMTYKDMTKEEAQWELHMVGVENYTGGIRNFPFSDEIDKVDKILSRLDEKYGEDEYSI